LADGIAESTKAMDGRKDELRTVYIAIVHQHFYVIVEVGELPKALGSKLTTSPQLNKYSITLLCKEQVLQFPVSKINEI
jgi:hypothetical protein